MQTVHNTGMLQARDGLELFFRRDIPAAPRGIVVIVHGLAEHCGRYDYVTQRLNGAGYGVYRFDNRGHGQSGGDAGWVEDFQEYIDDVATVVDLVQEKEPTLPVFVLGHSMGGFIATGFAIKYPGMVKGQIFSGPAVQALPVFADLPENYRDHGRELLPNALGHLISRDPQVVTAYAQDPKVLKHLTLQLAGQVWKDGVEWIADNVRSITVPALVLHGGDDQIVPCSAAQWLHEHMASTDTTLHIYPGLYHEILNEPEKEDVLDHTIQWLDDHR